MKLNSPTSLIFVFAFAGIAALLAGNWVAAAAFAAMAGGFALAAPRRAVGLAWLNPVAASTLPVWRRGSAVLLVCAAIALFGFQIGQALHQAVNHLSQ